MVTSNSYRNQQFSLPRVSWTSQNGPLATYVEDIAQQCVESVIHWPYGPQRVRTFNHTLRNTRVLYTTVQAEHYQIANLLGRSEAPAYTLIHISQFLHPSISGQQHELTLTPHYYNLRNGDSTEPARYTITLADYIPERTASILVQEFATVSDLRYPTVNDLWYFIDHYDITL